MPLSEALALFDDVPAGPGYGHELWVRSARISFSPGERTKEYNAQVCLRMGSVADGQRTNQHDQRL